MCVLDRVSFYILTNNSLQNPLLPVTVQDQIRLWELERNRLKSREGTSILRNID